MYFFTADEHFDHENIITYCMRPFSNIKEMNETIIERFNSLVGHNDITIHAGDFCLGTKENASSFIQQLNGNHVFLKGSHDHWLPNSSKYIWIKSIENHLVVVCHYAMLTWQQSHYNSWQLFGHSHNKLNPVGKQWDIGVDNNNFYPLSFEQIKKIMQNRPNNFNYVRNKYESV